MSPHIFGVSPAQNQRDIPICHWACVISLIISGEEPYLLQSLECVASVKREGI